MTPRARAFQAGVQALLPILLGVVPFGLVTGIAAIDLGLSTVEASGMSLIVYAGAAQLALLWLRQWIQL